MANIEVTNQEDFNNEQKIKRKYDKKPICSFCGERIDPQKPCNGMCQIHEQMSPHLLIMDQNPFGI